MGWIIWSPYPLIFNMSKTYLVVYVIPIILQSFAAQGCFLRKTDNRVRIINSLPEKSKPLTLHCASGDDDLGFHKITVGENYSWKFCPNISGSTLFFCHFWWNSKQVAFDVYKVRSYKLNHTLNVFVVKSDGIYLAHDDPGSSLKKYASW